MIEVQDLRKSYDTFEALKGISFSVARGEIIGFLGPNGAGKSTTMKILTGFMPQSSGTVRVAGKDIADAPLESRARMGYLPESTPLYGDMLVYDYLKHSAVLRGVAKGDLDRKTLSAAKMCGIADRVGQKISTLSKGYRQRVGLAQALIHDPDILVLDEPTSGLDPNQIVEIRNLIKRLGEDRTIILSTHNLPEVMATCTRMLIVHNGQLVADGTADELEARENANQRLRAAFRLADTTPAELASKLSALPGVAGVTADDHASDRDVEAAAHLLIDIEPGVDVRASISSLAIDEGWTLLELTRERVDIERLFRQLTQEV